MRYYDRENKRLVYLKENASSEYWDSHWDGLSVKKIKTQRPQNNFCVKLTKKYLAESSIILEGGCGFSDNVYALQTSGYKCVGIDFAKKTVKKVNELAPELDVREGDVFDLKLEDNSLDGYWSLGVVEHFWDGYNGIANEMYRTIKKDGYLFLTFPAMSPLRKIKSKLFGYKNLTNKTNVDEFYQFALDPNLIIEHYESKGFELEEKFFFDAVKGIKDEVSLLKPILQKIYDGKFPKHGLLIRIIEKLFAQYAGHCVCLVLQNKKR